MKKMFFLFTAILLAGVMVVNAQGGGFQRPPIVERVKMVLEKMEPFKLDETKKVVVDSIFTQSYKAQDAKMEQMRAGGSFDRESMMAEKEKATAERDEKLKKVLTEEQFKQWKKDIEPSTRPQRPGGGGGSGNK